MSADNGIYILETTDGQYRVIHATAIDNLTYEVPIGWDLNPEMVVDYFGSCEPLTCQEASQKAKQLADDILNDDFCPILEYGICSIEAKHTWEEYVNFAMKEYPNVNVQK